LKGRAAPFIGEYLGYGVDDKRISNPFVPPERANSSLQSPVTARWHLTHDVMISLTFEVNFPHASRLLIVESASEQIFIKLG
jgi:hypothetical protein